MHFSFQRKPNNRVSIIVKYKSSPSFTHRQPDKIGVLISNLGTPDAPNKKALKSYLKQFLSDPRVVEVPRLLWWLILNLVILQIRPKRSAAAYATVWTDKGSPLLFHTQAQAQKLEGRLKQKHDNLELEFAMRYGQPSIQSGIENLLNKGVRKLFVLPLYPQYSGATVASTFDAIAEDFVERRWLPELRFANCYHDNEHYIEAVAQSVRDFWAVHDKADKLVFSYHGVPLKYLHKGDPYHCQCLKTSRLIADKLSLREDQFLTTFQSRFGREEWLKPYTDETLKKLPAQGIKSIQVICPGFSADCLETIEEIGEENREYFLEAGGEKFEYIPALNDQDIHIDALEKIIETQLQGWLPMSNSEEELLLREERAQGHQANQPKP